MSEGRRASRGGGVRGIKRNFHWDKPERQGPVVEEPPAYPGAVSISPAPNLSQEDRKLVTINRLLVNHWRNSEFFVSNHPSTRQVVTFSNRFESDINETSTRKDVVVSHCRPEFFPLELLQQKVFFADRKGPLIGRSIDQSRRQRLREMEQKERETGAPDGEKQSAEGQSIIEMPDIEGGDDFGGDDYAHDYYADEDFDAHLEEGDDDGTF